MATKVTTLKNADKTDDLVPRTQLKGIFDKNGNYIDNDLLASDLNKLKGGVVDELVICTEDEVGVPIPVNADQLEGHPASYFATADEVETLATALGNIRISLYGTIGSAGTSGQTMTFETSDNIYICFARTRGTSNASLFYLTPRGGAITVVNLGGSQQASYYITASGTTITLNATYANLLVYRLQYE